MHNRVPSPFIYCLSFAGTTCIFQLAKASLFFSINYFYIIWKIYYAVYWASTNTSTFSQLVQTTHTACLGLVAFSFLLAPHEALVVHLRAHFVASPAEADVAAGVALITILGIARTALGAAITVTVLTR